MKFWLACIFSLVATLATASFFSSTPSNMGLGGGTCGNVAQIPVMTVTPSSYAFGAVTTGSTRVARFFLSNTGKGAFTDISTAKSTGVFRTYSTSDCEGRTLTAGQQCRFNIAYTPTAAVLSNYSSRITTDQYAAATVIPISGTGQAGVSYLINEDFNASTEPNPPTSWTTSGGNPDYDYTTGPIEGTQSLYVANVSASSAYAAFEDTASVHTFMKFKISGTQSNNAQIIRILDSAGTQLAAMSIINATKYAVAFSGGSQESSTFAINTDTVYYMWMDYVAGTGANSSTTLFLSTNGTKPATPTVTEAAGNATASAGRLAFVATYGLNVMADSVIVSSSVIGSQ